MTVTTQALKVLDDITKDKGDAIKQLLQVKSCCVTVVSRKLHEKFSYVFNRDCSCCSLLPHLLCDFNYLFTIYRDIKGEHEIFREIFLTETFLIILHHRLASIVRLLKKLRKVEVQ